MIFNPNVEHKFVMLGFLRDSRYISKAKDRPNHMYIKIDLVTKYPNYVAEKYASVVPLDDYVIITVNYRKIKKLNKMIEVNDGVFDDYLKNKILRYFNNAFFVTTGKIIYNDRLNDFSLEWVNTKCKKTDSKTLYKSDDYTIVPVFKIGTFKQISQFENSLKLGEYLGIVKNWNEGSNEYPKGILLRDDNIFQKFYYNFKSQKYDHGKLALYPKNKAADNIWLKNKHQADLEKMAIYFESTKTSEYESLIFLPNGLIDKFTYKNNVNKPKKNEKVVNYDSKKLNGSDDINVNKNNINQISKQNNNSNELSLNDEENSNLYEILGKKFKVTKSQKNNKAINSDSKKIHGSDGVASNNNKSISKQNNDSNEISLNKKENTKLDDNLISTSENEKDVKRVSKVREYILKNEREKAKKKQDEEFKEWNKKIELERLKKKKLREYRLKQQNNVNKGSVNSMANNGIGQKDFINLFYNKVKSLGLHYDKKDLVNFHTSMQCDGMVILSGLSGTGKSQLVRAYASTLGLDKDRLSSRICFIPVRPSWADDSDLLGYADTLNNVYRPGDSGLIDTLIYADHNPDKLYIVVFDEMNLAKVEHYFSQFLSVLEMSPNDRYIKLYNESLESRFYNKEKYPANVKVGDNVLFVGTVNTDETTFNFSDKVLDRSNVINLKITPFFEEINSSVPAPVDVDYSELSTNWYRGLSDDKSIRSLDSIEKHLLWDIHLALNKNNKNLGIGWRNVTQIESFIQCLPKLSESHEIPRADAIDIQLVQRVLTKVRGSEEQLKNLLTADDDNEAELIKVLDKYKSLSEFNESRKVIAQKAQELNVYGFTM